MNESEMKKVIRRAIEEDIGTGDKTTDNIIKRDEKGKGIIVVKEKGVVAGLKVAETVFEEIDSDVRFQRKKDDGDAVKKGDVLGTVRGRVRSILKGERLALNFLQRLSGIATKTRNYVKKTEGYEVRIVDTRKTTPTLRSFEKMAVRLGGGCNHRMGLYDSVLIKDNHIRSAGSIREALKRVKDKIPHITTIEIEVEDIEGVKEAIKSGVDVVLLDNMSIEEMKNSVELIEEERPDVVIEASGGITLENVEKVADTGVHVISVGALTHQIESLDIGLDLK